MKYSRDRNYYNELNNIFKNETNIFSFESDRGIKDFDTKLRRQICNIEIKALNEVLREINLEVSFRYKMESYEYNYRFKHSKIFLIKNNQNIVGFYEYIIKENYLYIVGFYIKKEFRGFASILYVFRNLIIELDKYKIYKIIFTCQSNNKYVKNLYKKLKFKFFIKLNQFDEVWTGDLETIKYINKKYYK